MPEMVNYTITQTRKVDVVAITASDAALIGEAAFTHGQMKSDPAIAKDHGPEDVWGNTTSFITEMSLLVERK
jgi:hypothetical protein